MLASMGEITKASRIFELENYVKLGCLGFNSSKKHENPQKESNMCFVEDNDPADYYF